MKDSIRQKSQQLWLKAINTPIVMQFQSTKDMHRAKFALYDACRKEKKQEILQAKELVEICCNSKNLTLTMRRRELNPFYQGMEDELDKHLGLESEKIKSCEAPLEGINDLESAAAESLKRFQEKVCGEKQEEKRPNTPYFRRD